MNDQTLKKIASALVFAADKHRNHRRKDIGQTPYINHPIDLIDVLLNEADVTDTDVLIAAILHDTVEDTDTCFEEIEQAFGTHVSKMVREVTDNKRLRKEKRKQLQIEHAAGASHGAKLIKLADKICNLRDMVAAPPAGWDLERRREYFDWCLAVVDQMRGTHPTLEKIFDEVYAEKP